MGEFRCPVSGSSTLDIISNPVRDIKNENIVKKILKGAFTMGHLSKCFILNTWMYDHIHNRFDLCMKGISPAHPFSLLYSLCICICLHVFLCVNISSQINADSLKLTWKTAGFVSRLYYSTDAVLFSPVSVSIHVSEQRTRSHIHSGVSPLQLRAGFLAWWPQNWGLYVPVHVRTARDRLCVSFHKSSQSVKKKQTSLF